MSDKKTKIDCRLITRGSEAVNTKAVDDLSIPDPDLVKGKKIVLDEIDGETKDGDSIDS